MHAANTTYPPEATIPSEASQSAVHESTPLSEDTLGAAEDLLHASKSEASPPVSRAAATGEHFTDKMADEPSARFLPARLQLMHSRDPQERSGSLHPPSTGQSSTGEAPSAELYYSSPAKRSVQTHGVDAKYAQQARQARGACLDQYRSQKNSAEAAGRHMHETENMHVATEASKTYQRSTVSSSRRSADHTRVDANTAQMLPTDSCTPTGTLTTAVTHALHASSVHEWDSSTTVVKSREISASRASASARAGTDSMHAEQPGSSTRTAPTGHAASALASASFRSYAPSPAKPSRSFIQPASKPAAAAEAVYSSYPARSATRGVNASSDREAASMPTRAHSSGHREIDRGQFSRTVSRHASTHIQQDSQSSNTVNSQDPKQRSKHAADAFAPSLIPPRQLYAHQQPAVPAQAQRRVNNRGSLAGQMGLPAMPMQEDEDDSGLEYSGRISKEKEDSRRSSQKDPRKQGHGVEEDKEAGHHVTVEGRTDKQEIPGPKISTTSGAISFHNNCCIRDTNMLSMRCAFPSVLSSITRVLC